MVPMDAAWHPPGNGTYQMQSNIINTRESVAEQKESMRKKLEKRNIPAELWEYYLDLPENWDYGDVDEKGLHNGIKTILLGSRTVTPYWVEMSSVDKFVSLKMKLTTLTQGIAEIDSFVGEDCLVPIIS